MLKTRTNNYPESGRGLGHVTPTIFGIRSNISSKQLELETSNLIHGFVWAMPSRRINNFPESWRGLGHVTLTIFGSTVGYPSDSLASCFNTLACIDWFLILSAASKLLEWRLTSSHSRSVSVTSVNLPGQPLHHDSCVESPVWHSAWHWSCWPLRTRATRFTDSLRHEPLIS